MYTPHPIPTLTPSAASAGSNAIAIVNELWGRIILTLQSIPVIPNTQGLFNPQTGEWLQPLVSFYDVLAAALVFGSFLSILLHISTGSGIMVALASVFGNARRKDAELVGPRGSAARLSADNKASSMARYNSVNASVRATRAEHQSRR